MPRCATSRGPGGRSTKERQSVRTASPRRPTRAAQRGVREQGLHLRLQPLTRPGVDGQDEAGLGPIEDGGVEPGEGDVAQELLLAGGQEAARRVDAGDRLDEDVVEERYAHLEGDGHARGVGIAQQPLADEAATAPAARSRAARSLPSMLRRQAPATSAGSP